MIPKKSGSGLKGAGKCHFLTGIKPVIVFHQHWNDTVNAICRFEGTRDSCKKNRKPLDL